MLVRISIFCVLWSSLLYGQQWEFIAPMPEARANSGITTLDDGNIVVSGVTDYGAGINERTTYVYNPFTNIWAGKGPLNVPHVGAPLVRLLDGRLFTPSGLKASDSMTTSCELYSPSEGTWKLTKSDLMRPRSGESAITLPNGKVLIVGGEDHETQTTHATCELYDPVNDTVTRTGNISHWQTGTMLFLDTPRQNVIMLSGYFVINNSYPVLKATEAYDIATGSWTVTAVPKVAHYTYPQQSIQLPNGEILAPSGYSNDSNVTPLIEIYTPETKTWRTIGNLPEPRYLATTVYIGNDSVLIMGGYSIGASLGPLSDSRFINIRTGAISPAPALQVGRYYHRAVVRTYSDPIDPEVEVTAVYVFGGYGGSGQLLSSCEKIEFRRSKKPASVTTPSLASAQYLKAFLDHASDHLVCTDNITSDHKIELLDALGKVVYSRSLRGDEHRVEVSAGGLPSGLYVFQATTSSGRLSSKVLLTH